jgi:hypothetical protein
MIDDLPSVGDDGALLSELRQRLADDLYPA